MAVLDEQDMHYMNVIGSYSIVEKKLWKKLTKVLVSHSSDSPYHRYGDSSARLSLTRGRGVAKSPYHL
jgi:hypothetical protein